MYFSVCSLAMKLCFQTFRKEKTNCSVSQPMGGGVLMMTSQRADFCGLIAAEKSKLMDLFLMSGDADCSWKFLQQQKLAQRGTFEL